MFSDQRKKKVLVISLDGWGASSGSDLDVFDQQRAPYLNSLLTSYPYTQLEASANSLGFNSAPTDRQRGQLALACGATSSPSEELLKKDELLKALKALKKTSGACQVLLSINHQSDWSINYLKTCLELARRKKLEAIYIHAILTEGVDYDWWRSFELLLAGQDRVKVVSVMGADYANNDVYDWSKTEVAYKHLTKPTKAQKLEELDWRSAAQLTPRWLVSGAEAKPLSADDLVLIFNEQSVKGFQLFTALTAKKFEIFKRPLANDLKVLTVGEIAEGSKSCNLLAEENLLSLGLILSQNNLRQLVLTEAYSSLAANYYALGYSSRPIGCDYKVVNSPVYAELAEDVCAGARELVGEVSECLIDGDYDLLWLGLPTLDLAGWIGGSQLMAACLPELDELVAKIIKTALAKDYLVLLTSACARSEAPMDILTGVERRDNSDGAVPLLLIANDLEGRSFGELEGGTDSQIRPSLLNVAPTILKYLELESPEQMVAKSLL